MAKSMKDPSKKQRLAQALRENLKKRKAQSRQRLSEAEQSNGHEDEADK